MILVQFFHKYFVLRFEGKRKRHGTKEYLEKQKLLHKVKRERKGARREIQQDNVFLARQKLAETLQRFVYLFFHSA